MSRRDENIYEKQSVMPRYTDSGFFSGYVHSLDEHKKNHIFNLPSE